MTALRAHFPVLLLLAACTATRADSGSERLAQELAGRSAGAPQACVPRVGGRSLEVVDERTLVYRSGDRIWVNRLERGCPGLDPLSTLIIEPAGPSYCRGDRVSGLEPSASIAGPACPLAEFTPYRR